MKKIAIEAIIDGDRESVWDRYTDPDHVVNWNFASDDWHCPSAENDLRVGGKYRARMEAKDGSFGFDFEATYDAVEPGKHFSYTMPDDRNVQVSFREEGNATRVHLVFDAESENPIEMQQQGWQAILNNFKAYVEST